MSELEFLSTFTITRPYPKSYWVVPGRLLAGEYPGSLLLQETKEKITGLLETGVDTFIDLTLFDHLEPYEPTLRMSAARLGKRYSHHKFGIRDFSVPTQREMKKILDLIDSSIESGHVVYVHCWGGVGRTGTVVGCYLARHGITGQAVLDEISQLRAEVPGPRQSPETDEQRRMVTGWHTGQ